jgi:hypothetical protein
MTPRFNWGFGTDPTGRQSRPKKNGVGSFFAASNHAN